MAFKVQHTSARAMSLKLNSSSKTSFVSRQNERGCSPVHWYAYLLDIGIEADRLAITQKANAYLVCPRYLAFIPLDS